MKNYKLGTFAAVLTAGTIITGCGTPLIELTGEELNLIAYSTARIVSKHNIQQKDGMINVIIDEYAEEEKDVVFSEESSQITQNDNTVQGNSGTDSGEVQTKVSLAEIMGHGSDLSVVYKGNSVSKHYTEGGYYSVDAESGKAFYVMKFSITNVSQAQVTLDNVSWNGTFKLVADDIKANAEVTFLNTDLATYVGTIAPGETKDVILLFKISEAKANSISTPNLQVIIDKKASEIKL